MARKKNTTEEVIMEIHLEEHVEESIKEPILKSEIVSNAQAESEPGVHTKEIRSIFTSEQKAWIVKCISDGYHYKDVLKRSKVHLNLDEFQYKILSENVVRIEDIYRNIEGK